MLRISYKKYVEITQVSAEAGCLKIVSWLNSFFCTHKKIL